jgi:ABC-2 type transport system permease protein
MLWYKSWLETRWRFVIGLVLLMFSACTTVLVYPEIARLLPLVPSIDTGGAIGQEIREAAELAREYRGYVWSQFFDRNFQQMWLIFAMLLGAGSLLSQASGGGALFTLSLPVSRERLLGVRAATGFAELALLALVPSLFLVLLSPAVGQSYSITEAIVHSVCLLIAGSVFYSLSLLLSTVFGDVWRPLLLAALVAVVLATVERFSPTLSPFGLFRLMSGETYFRDGQLPWVGLVVATIGSLSMLSAATKNIVRQDF